MSEKINANQDNDRQITLVDEQGKYTGNLDDNQKADILSLFNLDKEEAEELYGSVDAFIAFVVESAAMAEDSFANVADRMKTLLSNIDFTDFNPVPWYNVLGGLIGINPKSTFILCPWLALILSIVSLKHPHFYILP